jgi:hypothetical protein
MNFFLLYGGRETRQLATLLSAKSSALTTRCEAKADVYQSSKLEALYAEATKTLSYSLCSLCSRQQSPASLGGGARPNAEARFLASICM